MRLCVTVMAVLTCLLVAHARAQCPSNASSCLSCHEAQGLHPVLQGAQPWHVDHAFGDLCAACHGGDPASPAQAQAHLGLRNPLVDPAGSCASCHASDAAQRAERYALALAAAPPPPPPAAPNAASATVASEGALSATADRVLTAVAVLLSLVLYLVLRRRTGSARRPILSVMRAKTWSPYAAGTLLGLVVAFSEVVCGRPIAASGAFDKLAAYAGSWLFPRSQYYAHIMMPGITWQVWLVVGVLVGSFASSRLAGEARRRWLPDTQWQARFGASRAVRFGLAFAGALLVQIGADIAGGCTSGLAISGGAVLAPGAFVFMAGMFAGGIPTALLWYRGRAD